MDNKTTIVAIATAPGQSAIAVIRLSGADAFKIISKIFVAAGKDKSIESMTTHSLHYGSIADKENTIDNVLISIFRTPHSYTGEDLIEISCHGSVFIQQKILELLIDNGACLAKPGEFTMRAFLNKKMDLAQAEAVADLIASSNRASHKLAILQMRGGFSAKIKELRKQLLDFASLIELEMDFSEEDVEFANRTELKSFIINIKEEICKLVDSFKLGNVIKYGIPVAIIGKPNVGKSTLLNALLNEEKAIVSEIPGTTRDAIEDTIIIEGLAFRFIDTAGLRNSNDKIETFGIEKTYQKIEQAKIILFVFDITQTKVDDVLKEIQELKTKTDLSAKIIIVVANKTDELIVTPRSFSKLIDMETIFISAKRRENINLISESLLNSVKRDILKQDELIISNARHYEALTKANVAVDNILSAIESGKTNDLIASDMHTALHYLGEITGEISSAEILNNIFNNFCIGK
ncbi:MAG: tRNA uridine-5-carboxymethylaminomethyl(34) synthesis GTPase MnmE [Bacteroidales bacterium]|nr:tRNA uridine-5-carboxymethylaminomethyl(34) synthesis GTPase MnmE [Bacteroidales bacterium]